MKTRIAFYRGRKIQNSHALIGDRLICLVTGKPFSHCELVEFSRPVVGLTTASMLSSSLRDVSTGALLGATMTMGQLFTGVASLIREKELAAEAAANQPAEAPAES